MKPNYLFTSLLGVTALVITSCSAPKMAQNANVQDDVYNTTAQARTYKPAEVVQKDMSETSNTDYYGRSNQNYEMDYASRIDRFYYGSPWRAYYDPYYNYYGYNSFYGYNNFYSPYNLGYYSWYRPAYGYFGSPYYNAYWGPYSAYNYWGTGYYGGGMYGGGYYGGGIYAGTRNENYRPRPNRGSDARPGYNGNVPSRGNTVGRPSRPESYNPSASGARQTTGSRPTRDSESRPTYTPPTRESSPSRPTYSPPSTGSSNSGSGSSGSSGSSGGGSRPTRGGGRG